MGAGHYRNQAPTTLVTVQGSGGEFTINAKTGMVVGDLPEAYESIVRIDMHDYRAWLEANQLKDTSEDGLDILEVGYWYMVPGPKKDQFQQKYEKADASFRQHLIEVDTETVK